MTLFGKKNKVEGNAKEQLVQPVQDSATVKRKPEGGAIRAAARILLTFIVIILFAVTVLVVYVKSAISHYQSIVPAPQIAGQIVSTFSLVSKGALQYNDSRYIVEFAKIEYSIYNSQNTTAVMTVYSSNPVRRIYLLNVQGYCVDCFVGSSLYTSLNSSLRKYGLVFNSSSFNYVDINKIDSIPPESIIIIPSGLIPNVLFPGVSYTNLCPKYSNSTIQSLLQEGDIIMYVGRNFSRAVTCSGQIVQAPLSSLYAEEPLLNISSFQSNATSSMFLSNETFAFNRGTTYQSAAGVQVGQNGAMVVLSNYPSVGWRNNYTALASDIAETLASRFWIPYISNGTAIINGSQHASSTFTIFTTNLPIPNTANITDTVNSSYAMVKMIMKNGGAYQQSDIPVKITFINNGVLSMPQSVGLGQSVQLVAQVFNSSNRVVIAYAQIYYSNLTQVNGEAVHFGQVGPTPVYASSEFNLPAGYYFANLTDQNGDQYSASLFHVANANISAISFDPKNGTFSFLVQSNGEPVSSIPYTINLNGAYNATGYLNDGVLTYSLPKGTVVAYGPEQFNIKLLNYQFSVLSDYVNPGIVIPPLYIEVAIELVIVLIITKVLVPPNTDDYYIDVPDIRPVQKQILKENSDSIIDVFTRVNTYYHWRDMPLTVDEVKTGISNFMKYGNTRVSVTARNTYTMLTKLVAKGVVSEAGGYYAPKKWIDESGHSISYLVIYRKLRDFCVANAMLFTELDSGSNNDMVITSKSMQSFIKIYAEGMKVNEIEIKQGAKMFITFLDEEAKLLFLDRLYMSYGRNAEIMKMAIAYGNVKLIDTNHLDELKL